MAIQTIEQLKSAFGAGKFPNVTNWEDLIDTIFSRGAGRSQVHHIEMNAYESPWSTYGDSGGSAYYYTAANTDELEANTNIGGHADISYLNSITNHTYTSPYSPIFAEDFEKLYNKKEADIDSMYRNIDPQNSYISRGDIVLIHNDGAFYNAGSSVTDNGEIYIQWTAKGAGEYWDWYASDSRYYNSGTPKPQIIQLPLGCTVALAKTNGGLQPIGNFIAYDYDTLMQKVQNYPYNN